MWRLQTYTGLSLLSILAISYYAFHSRGQFYPAMVYLSTSMISLVLLLNMGLVVMCILWQLTKQVFLGSLREVEIEILNEQLWREVIELLFAITIFKQDFSVYFLAMVTTLLLIKGLHWLAQKRLEYIETIQTVTVMSHIRIASFFGFLLLVDGIFLHNSLGLLSGTHQGSVSLFFSFEYMILAITTVSTFIKYVFCVSDILMEGQWERKSVYTFYLHLVHDLLHLSLYLCFFIVIFIYYGVPLHLVRELYETYHNFKVRVADYVRYRNVTSNLNVRFPDATIEELSRTDVTCIICREDMTTAKKLICGHLFHVNCLRLWMERQHTCPTCRALVWPIGSETTTTTYRRLESQTDVRHQQASASTSQDSTGGGDSVDDNSSSNQGKIEGVATVEAASICRKSFVYPSAPTFVWNPGFAATTQTNGLLQYQQLGFLGGHLISPLPLFPTTIAMSSQLDSKIMFIEHQIEVLQNQLQDLQISRDEAANATDSESSDTKGKAIAYSSATVFRRR